MHKYNPIWLTLNNMDDGWHAVQSDSLKTYIDNCKAHVLKMIITSPHQMEAMATVLFKYKFEFLPARYYGFEMNELTIYIK